MDLCRAVHGPVRVGFAPDPIHFGFLVLDPPKTGEQNRFGCSGFHWVQIGSRSVSGNENEIE